jgi:hypothetical protein
MNLRSSQINADQLGEAHPEWLNGIWMASAACKWRRYIHTNRYRTARVGSPPIPAVYDVIMFDAIGVEAFTPTVDHLAPSA